MVTIEAGGEVKFRVYAPEARRVEILGTFTGWHDRPIAMERRPDGWWEHGGQLASGEHEFQYLIDRSWWLADYAAMGVRYTEHGVWSSLLMIDPRPGIGAEPKPEQGIETFPHTKRERIAA